MMPTRRMSRTNPWGDFWALRREMNDLFDGWTPGAGESAQVVWAPPVSIREDEGKLTIEAELPGVRPGDVDVTLENSVLTISGEKRATERTDRESWHIVERRYGRFERSFTVGRGVDPSRIEASFQDGVLLVTVPKPEEVRPRRIHISTGTEGREVGSDGK